MSVSEQSFIDSVSQCVARPGPDAPRGVQYSILAQAARLSFNQTVNDAVTAPTGFDPAAAALFEGAVESAYLVATSDGPLDPTENTVLRVIIGIGCDGKVSPMQIDTLLDEMASARKREGVDERLAHIAQMVTKPPHRHEVVRIAAIMARASGGVRPEERDVLDRIAKGFSIDKTVVDKAIADVDAALAAC